MTNDIVKQVEPWLRWIAGIVLSASIALASWTLLRVIAQEARTGVAEVKLNRNEIILTEHAKEIKELQTMGSAKLAAHDQMDEQRDVLIRSRLDRLESNLATLTKLSETWAVAANDIQWIKASLAEHRKVEVTP